MLRKCKASEDNSEASIKLLLFDDINTKVRPLQRSENMEAYHFFIFAFSKEKVSANGLSIDSLNDCDLLKKMIKVIATLIKVLLQINT